MTWIQTHFGHRIELLKPDPKEIDIRDIAHALARLCRFNGHVVGFYSVAEHSFWVARLIERDYEKAEGIAPRDLLLAALLHDAAEAYVADVSRPLKAALRVVADENGMSRAPYDMITDVVEEAIEGRFGLTHHHGKDSERTGLIKKADRQMLALEQKYVMKQSEHEWQSTKGVEIGEVSLSTDWPQTLRFPQGRNVEWEDIFLLEFARLTGGAGG